MKQAILLMAFVVGLAGISKAQVKTVTIKIPTVQCESCQQRIENTLARTEGVAKYTVSYKNKTAKVTFWTDRTNIENVKTAIANAGYDADDVTADAEAYKRLPTCCKKPADGGGGEKKQ